MKSEIKYEMRPDGKYIVFREFVDTGNVYPMMVMGTYMATLRYIEDQETPPKKKGR